MTFMQDVSYAFLPLSWSKRGRAAVEKTSKATLIYREKQEQSEKEHMPKTIKAHVQALVSGLMYYDRKECEDLPVGAIEMAIRTGAISTDEMVNVFKKELEEWVNSTSNSKE